MEIIMNCLYHKTARWLLPILACISFTAGCSEYKSQNKPAGVYEIRAGMLSGYLKPEVLPNSVALLPPPPAIGSTAYALDREVSRKGLALRGTTRWALAAVDASLMFPRAADAFSCALGLPITEKHTPHLYMLLRRTVADAGFSTYYAKKHYQRKRPFMVNEEPVCTPNSLEFLVANGSYPSGHAAIGWVWALILGEIAPKQADAIFARGRTFGESRIVCNVHWSSDVAAGRFIGAAAVARLHADPAFRADLEAARAEVANLRTQGYKPLRDCRAEADALQYDIF
jgi:acid phosphatase (class A)